ncbi:vitamin D3 hydroxylase-associated protein-like isoform X2 [Rhinoraja longicauda]
MTWMRDEFFQTSWLHQGIVGSVCGAVTILLALRWLERRRCLADFRKARSRRERALGEMARAVSQLEESKRSGDSEAILSLSLHELHEKLQSGFLTPDSVLHAYMDKALEVNKELNCLTDFLPECQNQLQSSKENSKGLLYGIPISIKDSIDCKGHDSTCGLRTFLNQPATKDSVIVQVLKKQGAVPFVKTNVPQSLLSYECCNPIFGQTVNPHNTKRTSGGSSGGEASLIAAGGSILGIGSDIGGSIRVPASFCGICGFKATSKRLRKSNGCEAECGSFGNILVNMLCSPNGFRVSVPGQKAITASIGPLARDVDSLALCMKALLCEDLFHLDPTVPPIPFNDEVYSSSKPLRIGYYESDGYWLPSASMKRAVMETKQLLEQAGHTLIPFAPLKTSYAAKEFIFKGLSADRGTTIEERLKGDIIDPRLKDLFYAYMIPVILKKILYFLMKPFNPRLSDICNSFCGVGSISELWKQHVAIEAYCEEYISLWKSKNLDVLLCPALGPAFLAGSAGKLTAGVVPVGRVIEKDEDEMKDYVGYYNDYWEKTFKKNVSDAIGLPIAVQCVALPWQDELCLRFMKEVERVTQKNRAI